MQYPKDTLYIPIQRSQPYTQSLTYGVVKPITIKFTPSEWLWYLFKGYPINNEPALTNELIYEVLYKNYVDVDFVHSFSLHPDINATVINSGNFISATLSNGRGISITLNDFTAKCKEWAIKNYTLAIIVLPTLQNDKITWSYNLYNLKTRINNKLGDGILLETEAVFSAAKWLMLNNNISNHNKKGTPNDRL